MSKYPHKKDWPKLRTDLEQKLETLVRQFITTGSFERTAVRSLGKEMSFLVSDLERLDSVEAKANEIALAAREKPLRHRKPSLKGRKGAAHPRSRAIQTPMGQFASLREAATAFNVSSPSIHQNLQTRLGWHYLDEGSVEV